MIYILYPILLCCLPVHCIYAQNISEFSLKGYLKTLFTVLLITLIFTGILNSFTNNINLSCFIFSILFFIFLYGNYVFILIFSEYKRGLKRYQYGFFAFYIMGALFIVGMIFALFKNINLSGISKVLFYISLFLNVFLLADILQKLSYTNVKVELEKSRFDKEKIKTLPDIYHIILDSHAGFFHKKYSDENFKNALLKRGFCVYENFQSNYNTTSISLPSMLNMEYIANLVKPENGRYLPDMTYPYYANNRVFSIFKSLGYKFNIFIDAYFYSMLFKHNVNMHISGRVNSLLRVLCFSSLAGIFYKKSQNLDDTLHHQIKNFQASGINRDENPSFSYMHILAPHWSYLCDENGILIPKKQQRNLQHFLSYTKYVDKQVIKLIDSILKNKKKNSLIILHSDHGPLDTHILMAMYLPEGDKDDFISTNSTLVNLYRCIFNKYFNTGYELCEDKIYKIDNYFKLREVDFDAPSA